ncbi:MAG: hypothetical protein Q7U71_08475 [bacterium]|nr:hypothetical protein [bacterium]
MKLFSVIDRYFIGYLVIFVLFIFALLTPILFDLHSIAAGVILGCICLSLLLFLGFTARAMLMNFSFKTKDKKIHILNKNILFDPAVWHVICVFNHLAVVFAFMKITRNLKEKHKEHVSLLKNWQGLFLSWSTAGLFIPFWYILIKRRIYELNT